jgi:hypothetical protein
MAPVVDRLEQENEVLRDHVAREVQRNLHQQVEATGGCCRQPRVKADIEALVA